MTDLSVDLYTLLFNVIFMLFYFMFLNVLSIYLCLFSHNTLTSLAFQVKFTHSSPYHMLTR